MAPMAGRKPFCADVSRENGEPLAATASRIDHWLLVEYRGQWSRDVLAASMLPDAVKEHLRAQLEALPRSRLLFIRRPGRRRERGFAVFHAASSETGATIAGTEVERYEDLVDLDLAGGLGEPLGHPLLVVCTHGKRDRCCARRGRPLYDAVSEQADEGWVWQSSHVGGDRFAGNLVWLPEGLFFGRVEPVAAWSLLDELLAGRIPLEAYRGRCCYPFPVQAAERALRADGGFLGVEDLRLAGMERGGAGWIVRFATPTGERELEVAAEPGPLTYLTCEATAPKRPLHFVVRRGAAAIR